MRKGGLSAGGAEQKKGTGKKREGGKKVEVSGRGKDTGGWKIEPMYKKEKK